MTRMKTRRPRLTIEPATWHDMKKVVRFIRSTADWYRPFLAEKDLSEHDVDMEWARENYAKRDFYIGWSPEGEAVGTISMQDFGDYCYLGYIYLDSGQVGNGFGGQLMSFAAEKAKDLGKKGLVLIAHPEASWATKAYVKFGFEKVASTKEEVLAWNDGLLAPYYEEGFELYMYELADPFRG